jgi:hypothetical protein
VPGSLGSPGKTLSGSKSAKSSKIQRDKIRKVESETKRIKRAEENKKLWFGEIKKLLDKTDEEHALPPYPLSVQVCKQATKDRRLIRLLYGAFSGQQMVQPMCQKQEFMAFVKVTCREFTENEISDMFLHFCKRFEINNQS